VYFHCSDELNNEELNDHYSSPDIVRLIKSRRMKWAGHVGMRGVYRVLGEKLERKRTLRRTRLDGRIILR